MSVSGVYNNTTPELISLRQQVNNVFAASYLIAIAVNTILQNTSEESINGANEFSDELTSNIRTLVIPWIFASSDSARTLTSNREQYDSDIESIRLTIEGILNNNNCIREIIRLAQERFNSMSAPAA